ncbi:hypothetical protein SISNIDRAFT_451160 [Sistotremastrum niveocremeum HHB9708]|uniref:F-box domain-containing protein n=1 Tax=Sistotremastrum niveocremeum HHB9708 TaxID=1314777 RepID=A0A164XZ53_9AGAM|nr:hypothetical protein SISNIDRAFT_451160 [Sistotremastrum niveocremeum HHB9708]
MNGNSHPSVGEALSALTRTLEAALKEVAQIASNLGLADSEECHPRLLSKNETSHLRDVLREGVVKMSSIRSSVDFSFSAAMVHLSEQSNSYTDIASLPEELLVKILTKFVENEMDLDRGIMKVQLPAKRKTHSWTRISTVCRQWNRIMKQTPGIWSFVDLSWAQDPLRRHAILSKDAPLHIFWNSYNCLDITAFDFMAENMTRIETLRIVSKSASTFSNDHQEFRDPWKTWITAPAPHLCFLEIDLRGRGGLPHLISLPDAPRLWRLDLANCFTQAPLPSSLRSIRVSSDARSLTHHDVVRVLVECPLLILCSIYISPKTSSMSETILVPAFPSSKITLPRLRYLMLGAFSREIIEWIFAHFILPNTASVHLCAVPFSQPVSFFVPEILAPYAPWAECLRISKDEFSFWTLADDQFHHSISASTRRFTAPDTLDPIIGLFPNLSRFYMDFYTLERHAMWMDALRRLGHLTLLSICGHHTELAEILGALTDPTLCPKLEILALKTLELEPDPWDQWDPSPSADRHLDRDDAEAERHLFTLLKARDTQNLRIRKLVLPRRSYTWANESNIERWTRHVDAVELLGEPISGTTIDT